MKKRLVKHQVRCALIDMKHGAWKRLGQAFEMPIRKIIERIKRVDGVSTEEVLTGVK